MIYKYRDAKFRSRVSAQSMGEIMDSIETPDGVVTPMALVNAARDEESSIHNLCTWDDAEEAEHHRRSVARRHIRQVVQIKTVPASSKEASVKSIDIISERVHNPITNGYQKIEVITTSPELYTACLSEIDAQISALKRSIDRLEASAKTEMKDMDVGIVALHEAFRRVDDAMAYLMN